MPRGVKNKLTPADVDVRIAELEAKIDKHQKSISLLKAKRKALFDSKNAVAYDSLLDAIKQSGKSPEEILFLLHQPVGAAHET